MQPCVRASHSVVLISLPVRILVVIGQTVVWAGLLAPGAKGAAGAESAGSQPADSFWLMHAHLQAIQQSSRRHLCCIVRFSPLVNQQPAPRVRPRVRQSACCSVWSVACYVRYH